MERIGCQARLAARALEHQYADLKKLEVARQPFFLQTVAASSRMQSVSRVCEGSERQESQYAAQLESKAKRDSQRLNRFCPHSLD